MDPIFVAAKLLQAALNLKRQHDKGQLFNTSQAPQAPQAPAPIPEPRPTIAAKPLTQQEIKRRAREWAKEFDAKEAQEAWDASWQSTALTVTKWTLIVAVGLSVCAVGYGIYWTYVEVSKDFHAGYHIY